MFETVINAPVMDNVETLPYFWAWSAWSDHVSTCAQCAHTIHETPDQAVEDLCWEGRGLNFAISAKIRMTQELALLN